MYTMRKKESKLYILVIFIGILVFLYPILGKLLNQKNQTDVIYKYSQKIKEMNDDDIEKQKKKYEQYNKNIINKKISKIDLLEKGKVLGYIKIDKIKLYLPIYEGTDTKTLYNGVCHLESTTLPVDKGNYHSVFVGHSGLTAKKIFDDLQKLKIKDKFTVTILNQTYTYTVYNIKKVLPEQTQNLNIKKGKQLVTLVTCTPRYINSHRLLIMGEKQTIYQ